MEQNITAYQLVTQATGKIRFEAMYVKYFMGTPYCAVFDTYPPNENTTILICRRLAEDEPNYRATKCNLISFDLTRNAKKIGTFVVESKASTEAEATRIVEANIRGAEAMQRLFQEGGESLETGSD